MKIFDRIVDAVRRVLYLVPTDHSVADRLDSINSVGMSASDASPRTTPYGSPAKRDKIRDREKDREAGRVTLRSLLDPGSGDITPFRLLYNVEVGISSFICVSIYLSWTRMPVKLSVSAFFFTGSIRKNHANIHGRDHE